MAKNLRERRLRAANRNQKRSHEYLRAQQKALLKADSVVLLAFGTRIRVRAGNGEWSNHVGKIVEFWQTEYGSTVRVRFEKGSRRFIARFDACQLEPFERVKYPKPLPVKGMIADVLSGDW